MGEGSVIQIEAMARIRLIHGGTRSTPKEVSFRTGEPSRLTVGSEPGLGLRIERSEVAPRQFEVVWDGTQLWLQDALRLGRTFVNGRMLNEWMPVVGQVVVCFCGVRLWMATRGARPSLPAPDFAALDRARLTDAHHSARLRLSETGRITLPPEFGKAR